jgi:hypothetical protein
MLDKPNFWKDFSIMKQIFDRYQKGNQNPYIEEEQTTQWPKEKSTKGQTTIYKTYI